jgi:hypothetical protein
MTLTTADFPGSNNNRPSGVVSSRFAESRFAESLSLKELGFNMGLGEACGYGRCRGRIGIGLELIL